jgi:RNA polymerase sigma-70 factor (ECF subfamily)
MPSTDRGNRQARIRALLDEHVGFVMRTLRRAGVPPADLDDEVQRTFIVAANRLEDLQLASERRFLHNVALNLAAHVRRKRASNREVRDDEALARVEALDAATPERLVVTKRRLHVLQELLGRLDESLQVVFALYTFDEVSMPQIAARLGIPRGTVASRLRRARKQIREQAAAMPEDREGTA